MLWRYRLAKVFSVWITGYSGGFGGIFAIYSTSNSEIDYIKLGVYPIFSGLIVALPQLSKLVNEWGNRGLKKNGNH